MHGLIVRAVRDLSQIGGAMIRRRSRPPDGQRILVKAILRVPTDLRDVFLLHRMAGLSYEQIGEHLGMNRDAVQAALAAALVKLASKA